MTKIEKLLSILRKKYGYEVDGDAFLIAESNCPSKYGMADSDTCESCVRCWLSEVEE